MSTTTLERDPDVLWIQFRTAIREGRLCDAAEAQRRLAAQGIEIRIQGLAVSKKEAKP